MQRIIQTIIAGALIVMLLSLYGCAVYPAHYHDQGYGPPPHAPAHGYRAKYQHHDLVYDSDLGVYVVVDLPGYYYHDGYYYRYDRDGWHYSQRSDRDWKKGNQGLPPGLAKKHGNGPGKGQGR